MQLICSSIDVESAKRSSLWGIFPPGQRLEADFGQSTSTSPRAGGKSPFSSPPGPTRTIPSF